MQKTNITILDGGLGRELLAIGAPFKQPEWSALALMEAPEMVTQAHDNFIEAGAQIITTNTYALVPFHIGQERFESQGRELIKRAAHIARDCADKSLHPVQVAGCIPPLFGSYKPENFIAEDAKTLIAPLIEEQSALVDFWIVETIGSLKEAKTIYSLLKETDKDIWLSFTLTDRFGVDTLPCLRSGEPLERALTTLLETSSPQGILFNCSQPEEMLEAIQISNNILEETKQSDIQIGAYANSFQTTGGGNATITGTRADMDPDSYLEFARAWQQAGATIIGGCCGIRPDHIKALADNLS